MAADEVIPGNSKKAGIKRKIQEVSDADKEKTTDIKRFFRSTTSATKSADTDSTSSRWKWKGTVMFYESEGISPSDKIAAFDFDGTLAKTSLFRHGPDAWSILYPSCEKKLTELHEKGYKLVIFTNQAGIAWAKASRTKVIAEKQGRLTGFVNKVNLPFQIFAASTKDTNHKPSTGMWDCLVEKCNGGVKVDVTKSFYVGDAAGRAKDHSASDKQFAAKCNLKFYTEKEFFS